MSAEDYETLCMRQDDECKRQLSEGRCRWCDWCELPPDGEWGWCRAYDEFTGLEDVPAELSCEEYKTDGIDYRREP